MSIIRSGGSVGSGNSVADYHWEVERCDECDGIGTVDDSDKEGLMEDLINAHENGKKFRELTQIYREWKKTETRVCPECDGKGKWERWY
jgi:RecJ-like exonuclease